MQSKSPLTLSRSVVSVDGQQGNLVFQIDKAQVWGSTQDYPYRTEFCVITGSGQIYHCSMPIVDGVHATLVELENDLQKSTAEWQYHDEKYLGAMWQSTLPADSSLPGVDIIAVQPSAYALQSRTDFSRVFVPALVLVVVLVALLSFSAISESLTPLQRLTAAVRQLTNGNLEARLRIRSDDEFEWLGKAFNKMANKLGGQISTLKAMSEIDRQILSGAKFEQVSECVLRHLGEITGYEATAVIARDDDRHKYGKLISAHNDEILHERIALPAEMGHQWCQPRQVSLEEVDDEVELDTSEIE